MAETEAVRSHLVEALEADLVGPFQADAEELLPLPPSRWYLTGFLVPELGRDNDDPTDEDEFGAGSDEDEEETGGQEPEAKQRNRLPASMGMSVFLPPGDASDNVAVTVSWADYLPEPLEDEGSRRRRPVWRRIARNPEPISLPLRQDRLRSGVSVPGSNGLKLVGELKPVETPEASGLEPGTRALSLFLVNRREPAAQNRDEQYAFQVSLTFTSEKGLCARPNRRDMASREWDGRIADLQFRERYEYAVGHNVSVEVPPQETPVRTVKTTWLPRSEVRRVVTRDPEVAGVNAAMEDLAELPDGDALRAALHPMVDAYGAWIELQRGVQVEGTRAETREALMDRADRARKRISAGIELLAEDDQARTAFCLANRAMAMAARQRNPERYESGGRPTWRLFQIAFVLLNVRGVVQPEHEDRETVELVFFPTGGGKSEAYLGVIAFTLLLRRLQGQERPDKGLGVAVLLRYTLRLLTLDQLGRAATLICALELIRQERPEELGEVRFAVGLWVGRTATANTMSDVARRISEYRNSSSANAASPFPLTVCPWCRSVGAKTSRTLDLQLVPDRTNPIEVVVGCADWKCAFSHGKNPEGLPVLFVDEPIYRELPSFIVATVDKFAMLPWRGETGMLFGRARAREGRTFYGPLHKIPKSADPLPTGLRPPELIVQDELHLISGPLGTMTGLYETAINALCHHTGAAGKPIRPKVIASTATVRRAPEQIRALFGRARTAVFPPPGVNDSDTYFSAIDEVNPGRLYLGVAAPGRAMKALLLRVYVSLLSAAGHAYDPTGKEDQTADGYMTLVGYFNSLRELGGMRRLVEDEVRTRCAVIEERVPINPPEENPWYRNRSVQSEPVELTSRETTFRIAQSRSRLAQPHREEKHVDVLLASNMISVGIDIDRLGLMVVAGQPKTTSEYIQASSRVGRDSRWPGLVVTCHNLHKPRDRSHFEKFAAYHESFYRHVEATSLTPFSGPALDRGLAGTLVAMVRLLDDSMTPPKAAMDIAAHRELGEQAVSRVAERGGAQISASGTRHDQVVASLTDRGRNILDSWETLASEAREGASTRTYSRFDREKHDRALLRLPTDEDKPEEGTDEAKFFAPTSMRDVEPTVHLWMDRRNIKGKG